MLKNILVAIAMAALLGAAAAAQESPKTSLTGYCGDEKLARLLGEMTGDRYGMAIDICRFVKPPFGQAAIERLAQAPAAEYIHSVPTFEEVLIQPHGPSVKDLTLHHVTVCNFTDDTVLIELIRDVPGQEILEPRTTIDGHACIERDGVWNFWTKSGPRAWHGSLITDDGRDVGIQYRKVENPKPR